MLGPTNSIFDAFNVYMTFGIMNIVHSSHGMSLMLYLDSPTWITRIGHFRVQNYWSMVAFVGRQHGRHSPWLLGRIALRWSGGSIAYLAMLYATYSFLHAPTHLPLSPCQCFTVALGYSCLPNTSFGTTFKPEELEFRGGPHSLCMKNVGWELATMTTFIGNKPSSGKGFLNKLSKN